MRACHSSHCETNPSPLPFPRAHVSILVSSIRYYCKGCLRQAKRLAEPARLNEEPRRETLTLPADIFDDIIGHDDVKDLLRATLLAEKPVHVLLAGPPALAKSLFLWDIERAYGEQTT